MDNVLEIIIRVVDQASQPVDKVNKKIKDTGTTAGLTGRQLNNLARAFVAVGAGIVAAFKAIQGFRDEAERLGRTDIVNNIDRMNQAWQRTADTLLSLKGPGGKSVADWFNDATVGATNLANVLTARGIADRVAEIDRMLSGKTPKNIYEAKQLTGASNLSDQQRNQLLAERAELLKKITEVANNPSGNMHNTSRISLEDLADTARVNNLKQRIKLVYDLVDAQKKLTASLMDQADAIRRGDARELNRLRNGYALSRPNDPSNFLASTPNRPPRGQATPDNPAFANGIGSGNLNVYIDGVQVHVKSVVRKTVHDEVIKPLVGAATGSSNTRR